MSLTSKASLVFAAALQLLFVYESQSPAARDWLLLAVVPIAAVLVGIAVSATMRWISLQRTPAADWIFRAALVVFLLLPAGHYTIAPLVNGDGADLDYCGPLLGSDLSYFNPSCAAAVHDRWITVAAWSLVAIVPTVGYALVRRRWFSLRPARQRDQTGFRGQ